ncbi:MAG: hypothetical protein ACOCW8_00475 [bacterium]
MLFTSTILFVGLFMTCCEKSTSYPHFEFHPNKLLKVLLQEGDTLFSYFYNEQDQLIEKKFYYQNQQGHSEFYMYNEVGMISDRLTPYEHEIFQYDENNRIKSKTIIYREGTDSEHQRTEYFYYNKRGIIYCSEEYVGNEVVNVHFYRNDEWGRIIEKKSYLDETKKNTLSELRLIYNNTFAPVRDYDRIPVDFNQLHNLSMYYHYSALMSSFPLEHYFEYEYDDDGYPVMKKEYFNRSTDTLIYTYIYEPLE